MRLQKYNKLTQKPKYRAILESPLQRNTIVYFVLINVTHRRGGSRTALLEINYTKIQKKRGKNFFLPLFFVSIVYLK